MGQLFVKEKYHGSYQKAYAKEPAFKCGIKQILEYERYHRCNKGGKQKEIYLFLKRLFDKRPKLAIVNGYNGRKRAKVQHGIEEHCAFVYAENILKKHKVAAA